LRNSGKSTILKQMKIIYQSGFSQVEGEEYRLVVYENILDAAVAVLMRMRKLGISFQRSENGVLADRIRAHRSRFLSASAILGQERTKAPDPDTYEDPNADENIDDSNIWEDETILSEREAEEGNMKRDEMGTFFPPRIAEAMVQVSQDPAFQEVLDVNSTDILDSASYFCAEIQRIALPGYIPNNEDILRARRKMWAITEEYFTMSFYEIRMINVGGLQTETRKWLHCFEGVTFIIFCTALSDYDEVLQDDRFQIPLKDYFNDYTGGADFHQGIEYIRGRFEKLTSANRITQATETEDIRAVFKDVVQDRIYDMNNITGVPFG
ncbi:hypothetical protein H0H92_003234, partial [Tricholoma furcatifolium]